MSNGAKHIALVTGANSGLGLACTKELARRGISTLMVARRAPLLKEESSRLELPNESIQLFTMAADVSNPTDVEHISKFLDGERLQVKWLINNAGVGHYGELADYSYSDIKDIMDANLIGTILMSQKFVNHLLESHGVLCNIISTAALNYRAKETVYTASKWGARGFTEALRAELKGKPVRVMAVYPGGMNTPFWDQSRDYVADPSKFMPPDAVAERLVSNMLDASDCQVSDITINRL